MTSQQKYFALYKKQPDTYYLEDYLAFIALLGMLGLIIYANWII